MLVRCDLSALHAVYLDVFPVGFLRYFSGGKSVDRAQNLGLIH